jgi:hypothetical protein
MPASSVVSRARGQGRDLFLAEADEPLRGHVHDPLAAGLVDAESDQRIGDAPPSASWLLLNSSSERCARASASS